MKCYILILRQFPVDLVFNIGYMIIGTGLNICNHQKINDNNDDKLLYPNANKNNFVLDWQWFR